MSLGNLGCEDFAESVFPGYPRGRPENTLLMRQPRDKRAIHQTTFKMPVSDMATDYYDSAFEYFEKFRRNPHSGDPIKQFKDVVDFFSVKDGRDRTVRDFLDKREQATILSGRSRISAEIVMRILAIWLCIPGLNASTVVTIEPVGTTAGMSQAPAPPADNYSIPLGELIKRCLPTPVNWDGPGHLATNRKHLYDKRFNGGALRDVAGLELEWTRDITEHLKLENRTLKLFKTAGFCYYSNYCSALSRMELYPTPGSPTEVPRYPAGTKFPPGFTEEVSRTFELLFGLTPWSRGVLYNELIKDDETLQKYIRGSADIGEIWTCDWRICLKPRHNYFCEDFPYFGPRLLELEDILKEANPNSLMQLFRDSRNTLQYWTFITAIAVFVLALLSMLLQVVQAVAAWVQVAKT